MALPSFTTFTAFTKIKSSEVNANFTSIYNVLNGNIENANVAAAAAIARTKLASGTADHVLINNGSGVMSSEASLAVTRGGTGLSAAALGDLIYGSAANTLSRLTGNTTTTQKFLRQVGDGVNSAAPSWEAVSLSAGVTGTLPIANGGTGQTSATAAFNALHPMTTTGDMIYSSSGSTAARLAVGSSGQVLKSVGGVPTWATFSGGINYLSSNPDAESDTSGWSTYADAAGSQPVDGTGGSPTETWTRTTSSPLRGAGSFLLTKDAANRQGEGVAFAMTIDSADQAKILQVDFDYTVASGTYATGDLTVYLYDVTNAVVIQPAGYQIQNITTGLPSKHIATFQTSSNSTSYRFIIHTASTSASAYTVKFDNFRVGPQIVEYGAPVTDWVAYTPTGGWNTNVTYTGFWRRVGDSMEINAKIACTGAPNNVSPTISLPTGYTIDTAKLAQPTNESADLGTASLVDTGTKGYLAAIRYNNTTSVQFWYNQSAGLGIGSQLIAITGNTVPFTYGSGDSITATFRVPIVGWSSTVQMSNDTDTRVVAAIVTGDPASATSGNPIIVPTVSSDTHGAYNSTTGRYTTPVPGYYRVSGALQSASSATTLTIYKNAVANVLVGSLDSNGEATFTGLVNCSAGDLIDIRPGGTVDATSMTLCFERLTGPAAIAASETVAASYSASSAKSSTTAAPIDFDTKAFDSHNAVTVGASWKFTAPVPGKYSLSVTTSATTSSTAVAMYKNGSQSRNLYKHTSGTAHIMAGYTLVSMIAGDYLDVRSQANTTFDNDSLSMHISIHRVGN